MRSSISSEPSSAAFENFSCHFCRSFATILAAFSRISASDNGVLAGISNSVEDTSTELLVKIVAWTEEIEDEVEVSEAKDVDEELKWASQYAKL